jgi:hypothetical protein
MARSKTVDIKIRLREPLRAKIEAAAKRRSGSMNAEMISRLEDSFAKQTIGNLQDIADDMKLVWEKYGDRFLKLELADEIFEAIESGDLEAARRAARLYRQNRSTQKGQRK